MAKPRHTRHGSVSGGGRPHRSRSKVRATRFGDGTASRKKSKKPKRRYEHGAHGPEKKRKKRRRSTKKRRKLRFTIRYDKPAGMRRGHRRSSIARPRRSTSRSARPVTAPTSAPVMAPEVAALTAAITSRAHHAIVPRSPIVPRMLTPKRPHVAPVVRSIIPKLPANLAVRTVK